ncbi:MAG: 4Fe-4S single cluster domain-containing protein [Anaerolineae bacterium]
MSELTWLVDPGNGALVLEGMTVEEASALAGDLLPPARSIACAQPVTVLPPPVVSDKEIAASVCLRVAGYYHNSLIEGPGQRSVLKMQGCPLRCRGCIAQETWPFDGGALVPVERLADVLLDPAYERDGVTILGGEPFAQPEGLRALVQALRGRGCPHILCYSGYAHEQLWRMAACQPAIQHVLDDIDILIDGPYVAALAIGTGEWRGSRNQRIIYKPSDSSEKTGKSA